jgi:hypothetical protein
VQLRPILEPTGADLAHRAPRGLDAPDRRARCPSPRAPACGSGDS